MAKKQKKIYKMHSCTVYCFLDSKIAFYRVVHYTGYIKFYVSRLMFDTPDFPKRRLFNTPDFSKKTKFNTPEKNVKYP